MRVLVVASSEKEIKFVLEQEVAIYAPEENVYKLDKDDCSFDFLISGIGIVASSYQVTRALNSRTYDLVVHVGLAGSYRNHLRVGTVVSIGSDVFDLGYYENGTLKSFFDLGLMDRNAFPFKNGRLINNFDLSRFRLLKTVAIVNAVTVSKSTGNANEMVERIEKYNPDIETLDGAAVLYVCQMQQIKCISLRAISYQVETFNYKNWSISETLFSLGKHLYFLINEITRLKEDII